MWRKVMWLFVGVTLAFWAGCTNGGEDQNYKINRDDTPAFEEGYPTQPGGGGYTSAAHAEQEAEAVQPGGEPLTASDTDRAYAPDDADEDAGAAIEAAAAPMHEPGPPLTGIDRSDWTRIRVSTDPTRVGHHPGYFESSTWMIYEDRRSVLRRDGDIERIAASAVAGDHYECACAQSSWNVLTGSLKSGTDVVLLPLRLVEQPPPSVQYAPKHPLTSPGH